MKYKSALLNSLNSVWDELIFILIVALILTIILGIWIGMVYVFEIIGAWGLIFIPALYLVGVFIYNLYQEIFQKSGEVK